MPIRFGLFRQRFAHRDVLGALVLFQVACSQEPGFVTWQEEVLLADDRTIVVEQRKTCEGGYNGSNVASCIPREGWLTINLQELSAEPIVWHQGLSPILLNVDSGHLYVVGIPPTEREFDAYGKPKPPYGNAGQWKHAGFKDIPESIYDTNMVIEFVPPKAQSA